MKAGRAKIGILQKMRIKNLRTGVSEVRFKKTRLLHLGNVEKPPHPSFLRNGRLRVKSDHTIFFLPISARRYLPTDPRF